VRILFLVARPTQFEAPFFRFAARDPAHELKPLFWEPRAADPVEDRELGRAVEWGFDVLEGYPSATAPDERGLEWIARELDAGCDLFIINGYTSRLCRGAAALARRRRIRTALRLDSALFPGDPRPTFARRALVRFALRRRFDLFLGTSTLTLGYLAACGIESSSCALFPYAVDHEHFRRAAAAARPNRAAVQAGWGVPAGARVVLAVAKLHPRETPWDLIDAAIHLPSSRRVVLIGDGPERAAVEARVRRLPQANVHLAGYRPYRELPAAYAAADVFVHVPQEERWGVSVAEALASGLPVVAGRRVGAAHDLIARGRNGLVVDAGRPAELATAVESALGLDRDDRAAATDARLALWDYAASWRSLLSAAGASAG
jgi:glycosyltransferase involved in cell wall biosynthesis